MSLKEKKTSWNSSGLFKRTIAGTSVKECVVWLSSITVPQVLPYSWQGRVVPVESQEVLLPLTKQLEVLEDGNHLLSRSLCLFSWMLFPDPITAIKKQLISYNVPLLLKLLPWLLPADSLKSKLSSIHSENTFIKKSSVILLWSCSSPLHLEPCALPCLVLVFYLCWCCIPSLNCLFFSPLSIQIPVFSSSPHPPSTQSTRPSLFILLSFRWRPFFAIKELGYT